MGDVRNTMTEKGNGTESRSWLIAAKQTFFLRQQNRELRLKRKAQRTEQNEQFRSMVNYNR